jgi:hypothetical protein
MIMDNVARLEITIGSLKVLLMKGTDIMFVSHHVDNFLDYVGEKTTAWLRGETCERLTQLAQYIKDHRVEVNYGFYVAVFENAFELLKPITSAGYEFKCLPPEFAPLKPLNRS